MTTFRLTLTNLTTRAAFTVQVQAASYSEAVGIAWQRWARRSNNQVVVR